MNIFFIADTHFNHSRILEYEKSRRELISSIKLTGKEPVHIMNDIICTNWNSVVKEDDIVVFLGDLGFFSNKTREEYNLINILKRLKGGIVFVSGNHDKNIITRSKFRSILSDRALLFSRQPILIEDSSNHVLLSHEPSISDKYINIHGHTHSRYIKHENGICVSCEMINFYPKDLEDLDLNDDVKELIKYYFISLKEQ